jgi:hypothetical protein
MNCAHRQRSPPELPFVCVVGEMIHLLVLHRCPASVPKHDLAASVGVEATACASAVPEGDLARGR